MNKSNFFKSLLLIILFSSSIQANEVITIGTIDGEPENKFLKFEAISKYLQKKLNRKNLQINVEIPKDTNTAIQLINENKLHIFIDSVYPTIIVQKKTGLTIETKRWKKGKEGYKSIIFTKKDSNINSIIDLEGKTIAFENEFSTSAYYIPKKAIEKHGLLVSNEEKAKSVRYSFARSEDNATVWVLFGKVDAAAIDDITFNSLDKNLYKVIYKSELIPRHLVSFSKNINIKLKKEILDILYNMHKDDEGKEVLNKFSKTKKFSPLKKDELKLLKWN